MPLVKIISGGQRGADLAGVIAAKEAGIEYGGTMPKGFKNESGLNPDFAAKYNMEEHSSEKYPPRTYKNVKDSDATIRFATNFDSPGERCTKNAIDQYKRLYMDVQVDDEFPLPPEEIAMWIINNEIRVLNVAGNRETTSPGIEKFVKDYILTVITQLKAWKPNLL